MIGVQTGLQDMCYSNYNGTYYSSFIFTTPYRFEYSGENCNAANTLEAIYLDTSGACVHAGGGSSSFATYSMSGTNANADENDENGVGTDMLAIAIVFSFIGGVILTVVGVFCWIKFGRKPLGAQGDNVQMK